MLPCSIPVLALFARTIMTISTIYQRFDPTKRDQCYFLKTG